MCMGLDGERMVLALLVMRRRQARGDSRNGKRWLARHWLCFDSKQIIHVLPINSKIFPYFHQS